jgi:Family of unknown function (DUF6111)
MIRPILIELALFLTPFAAYAVLLWAKNHGVFDPESWPLRTVVALTASALVLMAVSALVTALISGAPPGSTYVPAHVEGGRLVPGTTQ